MEEVLVLIAGVMVVLLRWLLAVRAGKAFRIRNLPESNLSVQCGSRLQFLWVSLRVGLSVRLPRVCQSPRLGVFLVVLRMRLIPSTRRITMGLFAARSSAVAAKVVMGGLASVLRLAVLPEAGCFAVTAATRATIAHTRFLREIFERLCQAASAAGFQYVPLSRIPRFEPSITLKGL